MKKIIVALGYIKQGINGIEHEMFWHAANADDQIAQERLLQR